MPLTTEGLNVWAILLGALAYFTIGALWYTVLFAKAWIKAYDLSEEDLKDLQERQTPAITFPAMLVCNVVTAVVFSMLIAALEITGTLEGVALGALLWLGFGGACALTTQLGAMRSVLGFVVDSAYHLVALMTMGAILASM